MSNYQNILLFKPGAIGDLLQITPVIEALHQQYPLARITLMVGNRGTVSLFKNHPLVNEVMVYERKGEHAAPAAFITLWQLIRLRHFDLVVNFQRSNLKGWLLLLAAFPARYLVYHKARNRTVHAVVNHLETLLPLGIKPSEVALRLSFYPGAEAVRRAELLFLQYQFFNKRVIALNPGASHPVNRWGTKQFAELSDKLAKIKGVCTVLIGGGGDRELADEIVRQAAHPPLNLVGTTDIELTGALLARCAALVSGDTGPMHLATAVGTPVFALFGAADPERTGPVGKGHLVIQAKDIHCVPCRSRVCTNQDYLACMTAISADNLLLQLKTILR
jgi:heptosyltransferase II